MSPDDALLRGDEASRAEPVDLLVTSAGRPSMVAGLNPVGPWAQEVTDIREAARREGYTEGYDEGWAEGLRDGHAEGATQVDALVSAVESALAQLGPQCQALGRQLATDTVTLAYEIAGTILRRHLDRSDDAGAEAIARCLDLAPSTGDLVVHLNPGDAARLGQVPGLGDRGLRVVADERLASGDAIVSVDDTTIDARLGEALRRAGEALT